MRWQSTESSKADFKRLSPAQRKQFRVAVDKFSPACDRWVESGEQVGWPKGLRVRAVEAAPGVFEMTWSFSGPDGRATWERTTVEVGDTSFPAVRWRRIGGHAIFKNP